MPCMHACMHIWMLQETAAEVHSYMHACMHACANTYACVHTCIHACCRKHRPRWPGYTAKRTRTPSRRCVCTHACMRVHGRSAQGPRPEGVYAYMHACVCMGEAHNDSGSRKGDQGACELAGMPACAHACVHALAYTYCGRGVCGLQLLHLTIVSHLSHILRATQASHILPSSYHLGVRVSHLIISHSNQLTSLLHIACF